MDDFELPWLPAGHTLVVPGRGELFYRRFVHPDPEAPTVLLLHGLTGSTDLQFFSVYERLAECCSFIGPDHRGHGRGMRSGAITLEDMADDAAALLTQLGIGPVVTIGYSMGGPISLLLSRRHPHLVSATVVQATAMEWRSQWWERIGWRLGVLSGILQRSWIYPHLVRRFIRRLLPFGHAMHRHSDWVISEIRRGDPAEVVQAGYSLSRFDGREWVPSLGKPAAALITTRDRLVPPHKQRALAEAMNAVVETIDADHLGSTAHPDEYAKATITLLQAVTSNLR